MYAYLSCSDEFVEFARNDVFYEYFCADYHWFSDCECPRLVENNASNL